MVVIYSTDLLTIPNAKNPPGSFEKSMLPEKLSFVKPVRILSQAAD